MAVTSIFSFFLNVFTRLLFKDHYKSALKDKGLKLAKLPIKQNKSTPCRCQHSAAAVAVAAFYLKGMTKSKNGHNSSKYEFRVMALVCTYSSYIVNIYFEFQVLSVQKWQRYDQNVIAFEQ